LYPGMYFTEITQEWATNRLGSTCIDLKISTKSKITSIIFHQDLEFSQQKVTKVSCV
jgi:hypothetical protein